MIHAATALAEAGREFVASWPRLLATDLLYKIVAFATLTPLAAVALRVFVATSGGSVLADEDILYFLLSPLGVLALVVISGLGLAIVALEQAGLMTICHGAAHGLRVPVPEALRHGLRHALGILRLAVRVVGTVVAIAAPFLAVGAFVGLRLLTEFDINYYLAERPPAFWAALSVAAALGAALCLVLVPRLAGWTYALPILLFEGSVPGAALRQSAQRVAGDRWRLGAVFVGWLAASALASSVLLGMVGWLGRWLLPRVGPGVGLIVLATGSLFLLWSLANVFLTFFQSAGFAVLVVGLYQGAGGDSGPGVPELLGRSPASSGLGLGPVGAWGLLGLLAVGAAGSGIWLAHGVRADDDALVIAHRGAAGAAPENTLASVARALDARADMVEIDVQETADGHVVVAHDADLMKVAGNPIKIWDATLEDLSGIDVGTWFAPEFSDQRVPTLRQVLELSRDRARVDIELKYYGHDVRLEERVVETVEELGMADRIVVMSLKYAGIQKMRALRPNWRLGLLAATAVGDLTTLDADFLAVNTAIVTRRFIRSAHSRAKSVYVWTVNDPVVMWRLLNLGVDGLITDEPTLARQVLDYRAELSSPERLLVSMAILLGDHPVPSGEGEA